MESYIAYFKGRALHREKGITLIELVVVLAIVSCLAAFALPSFENVYKENRLSHAKSTLLGMQLELDKYLFHHGEFPNSADGLVGIEAESSHYEFLIEQDKSCGSKWCYALVAQPKKQSRTDEMLKLYSSGNKEGNW